MSRAARQRALKRRNVGVIKRTDAIEDHEFHALFEVEKLAGAAVVGADPPARQHFARRHDDGLLIGEHQDGSERDRRPT